MHICKTRQSRMAGDCKTEILVLFHCSRYVDLFPRVCYNFHTLGLGLWARPLTVWGKILHSENAFVDA